MDIEKLNFRRKKFENRNKSIKIGRIKNICICFCRPAIGEPVPSSEQMSDLGMELKILLKCTDLKAINHRNSHQMINL